MNPEIEKLPETIRIDLEAAGHPGFSVLVIPNRKKAPNFREFYLIDDDTDAALYMFGLKVNDAALAAEIAVLNVNEYRERLEEREQGTA